MTKMNGDKEVLLLIDSHALIHRAFHAFPESLTTRDGRVVNAVYGFTRLLLEVLAKFEPKYVIAVFDAPGPTFRHQDYGAYKAHRPEPDASLIAQIPLIEELLAKFDVPVLRVPGFEADDIIGTLDARHSGEGKHTIVVTGDRDLFQLVDADTSVYMAGSSFSASKLYGPKEVEEKMGVGPEYITDIKALQGDASDNIPGVPGIGEKGAVTIVSELGHLEEIYKQLDKTPSRYQKKLTENQELAQLSKKLGTIDRDTPLSFDFAEAPFGTFKPDELKEFFNTLEFRSLERKLVELIDRVLPKGNPQVGMELGVGDIDRSNSAGDIVEWEGQKIEGREIFLLAEYNTAGDPYTWKLEKAYILRGEDVMVVQGGKLANFIDAMKDGWVITVDAKELLHVLANEGLELKARVYDMALTTYVVSMGSSKQDLDGVFANYGLPVASSWDKKLSQLKACYEKQKEEVEKAKSFQKLLDIELKLVPVVVGMERNGISLDVRELENAGVKLGSEIEKVQKEIFADVGHEFNISSPKQVGEVLFVEKGLPTRRKTKTGSYSTDERTLLDLIDTDPVVRKILDYRELTKLLSTYVKPLPTLVNGTTGRVHARFNQLGAVTGRFSSQYPNLQNIPLGETAGVNMRNAFVSAKGSILVAFDYSQQELRLLAEFSNEPNMLKAFAEGKDIHATTAAEIFDTDIAKVTKEQRKIAKTINFGIVYGMSGFGLADRLKISPKKASEFIERYFAEYPRVKEYYKNLIEKAKIDGYVETILGRRRVTQDLHSRNWQIRSATEREVMNFPLQGSAADVIKLAMVEVDKFLSKYPAKLVLQVHDELVYEYEGIQDSDEFTDFVRKVSETMLGVIKLKIPLAVGVEVGHNWGSMEGQ